MEIKTIIEREGIEIPNNIILVYQNTQNTFKNNGFFNMDNLTKINTESLYNKLAQPNFSREIDKLFKKNLKNNELDLIAFEIDLSEFINLYPFMECQNQGDNFFDPKTISDFKEFNSSFNNDDSNKSE